MNIIPLNNNLENKKKSTITLYVDCCCCCCCCILAPLGSVSAEAVIKKKYKLSGSIWVRGLINFLFFMLSIGLFVGIGVILDSFFNISSINIIEGNTFIFFATISSLFYFSLLYIYSKLWLKGVTTQQRLKAVLLETILSLVCIFSFSIITVLFVFAFFV